MGSLARNIGEEGNEKETDERRAVTCGLFLILCKRSAMDLILL